MNLGTAAAEIASDQQTRLPAAPSVSLPKGGGAIRSLGEKFAANPVTGTGAMSVPIATSPGRSGFGPQLSLAYDSGAGNGPFGFGWSLSVPSITRKTDKGLPQFLDAIDSDVFMLSGAEDLVPVLVQDDTGKWIPDDRPKRTVDGKTYRIRRYRPRIEGLFARIERWTNTADGTDVFWRSISRDNVTTWYGRMPESRVADPMDGSRIFSWLICQSHDDKGNVIVYGYKAEDSARIFEDANGNAVPKPHERNRSDATRKAQRYLKCIRYGNRAPFLPVLKADAAWPEPPAARITDDGSNAWMFEAVFDYGDHDANSPMPHDAGIWPARQDPFSSYRAGFEVRTYRLCQRVLMFHHFPGEVGVERNCLVGSTDFNYSDEVDPSGVRNPVYTFLKTVTQTGYRRHNGGGYESRSLPPVQFEYTEPAVQETVEEVDPANLRNLPAGLDGSAYRWTDLHGEGLPGILTEQAGAWFYKRNRSPLANTARFAPLEAVDLKPNVALNAGADFMDLAGDGQPDVVVMEGPASGLYEHDDAEGWQPFRPFAAPLHVDFRDPNLKLVDVDGDGHADVLITEDDALVWHASLAEAGFSPARRVANALDEEKGPRIVFADGTQSIFLADMSGDGLADLVRIRNSEICYWPNLGYCRFGARVAMTFQDEHGDSACFDHCDQFDHKRIRLADIDGSGTTDIIYLHRDGVRLYFNQSGNGWSQPCVLKVFPRIDDLVSIVPTDLLGNGTACLAWSSPLPGDARRPMRYVNLMGGHKPHLLARTFNNLGAETRVDYAPSTRFYLQDKDDGRPWVTRLPFPVHVVERVETWDHVSRNRFVSRYAYHHGYFDGVEREFRGFGMVEQWDTEQFAALANGNVPADNVDAASHVPPVHTKTWYHTGVCLSRERVSRQFESEYFREPGLTVEAARPLLLDDSIVATGLTLEEERQACRALKGLMLRQEVYALDGVGQSAEYPSGMPYAGAEQNFTIRTLQPSGANRHAVFFTHACETISVHYERNPADPRIQHALTLEVDAYGNVLKQAAIGYGRRASPLSETWDRERQTTNLLTYTENHFTKDHDTGSEAIDREDDWRVPLPCEALTFELTGYVPTGSAARYQASDFVEPDPTSAGRLRHKFTDEVSYESGPTANPCRRPVNRLRTHYRRDDLNGMLPLGKLQPRALPGDSYRLAFTSGLLTQVFQRPRQGLADEPLLPEPARAAILGGQGGSQGGYIDLDGKGCWWIPSGRTFYHPDDVTAALELAEARAHFFLLRRYRDRFGKDTTVTFDGPADPAQPNYDLLVAETRDALGNRVTVESHDYRVLQPRVVSDPSRNRTEVAFDTLGMTVGTAVMGKPLPAPAEGDTLDGFATDLTPAELDGFAADPHDTAAALLKGATTRIVYDLDRFWRTQQAHPNDPTRWQPACAATIARETHALSPLPPQGLKIRTSFSYSDGFGREIQKKMQAEPGPVPQRDAAGQIMGGADGQPVMTTADASPRSVGSGWTIFNNKGRPVRQYEPFFSDTHRFEFGITVGVSPVLFYDPAERVIATLHPNHTYEKVVFDPWRQTTYDVNDTSAARNLQTGDPRTDPDIGGYVAGYFETQPGTWQTWHAQRIGGALGVDEKKAAERAAAHADTPTTAHFDALGRHFLTVARNRVVCEGHPLDGKPDEAYGSRVEVDIEGNQRKVIDERRLPDAANLPLGPLAQRTVMQYAYDMLGNRIHQHSMEGGARWTLNDAAGTPILAWDSRGHNFTTKHDALRRPIERYVRGTFSDPDPLKPNSDPRTMNRDVLVDKIEYGEPPLNATPAQENEAQRLNLRTRIYRHFDSAGVTTNARIDANGKPTEAFDFKGNLLRSTRRLVSDYKVIPDWQLNPPLDAEFFVGSTRYDALNRPIQAVAPRSSLGRGKVNVIQPVFNEANLLERVDVWLARAAEPAGLLDPANEAASPVGVDNIDYDAKGQRQRIDYKNGASTVYRYDPLTHRLSQLLTRRKTVDFPDDDPQDIDPAWPGKQVQNQHYTYDPVGNITHIRDDAQQAIYFRNQRVEPGNDYVYDALYRLIRADGREHLGQLASGERLPPTAPDAFNAFHTRLDHPGNGNAMGTYTERYVYDAVGNFMRMQHRGSDPAHAGWTRDYAYDEASLIEPGKKSNRLSRTTLNPAGTIPQPETCQHDAHGNMLHMPHLGSGPSGANMHWDYRDQLRKADKDGGAFYLYDASGQRVRKVWEKSANLIEERIYVGGFEIFRRHNGAIGGNTATLERETLQVMDDKQRIALVETRTLGSEPGATQRVIRYQFGNHLSSASLELDEGAQVISYEEYAPYGSSTYQAVRSQTEAAKRYRYTGKERDEESGLYYHGARYLMPWLGRWAACDPAGLVDGACLYAYVRDNPVARKDPKGRQSTPVVTEAGGGKPPPGVIIEQGELVILGANGKISQAKKTVTRVEGQKRQTVELTLTQTELESAQKRMDAARRDQAGVQDAPSSSGGLKFSNPLGDTKYGEGRGATGPGSHGLDQDANTDQWETKSAQDMMAPVGTPVRAATAGTIVWITLDTREKHTGKVFGDQVTIRTADGQLKTFYTHMDLDADIKAKWLEKPGRQDIQVGRGQVIGHVTTWEDSPTGTHLHFGVASRRPDGTYKGIDPVPLLRQTKGSTEAHDVTLSGDGGYTVGGAEAGTALPVAPVAPPPLRERRTLEVDYACVRPPYR